MNDAVLTFQGVREDLRDYLQQPCKVPAVAEPQFVPPVIPANVNWKVSPSAEK